MKKKGLIFTLDAAFALIIVVIILFASSFYISTLGKDYSLAKLQMIRTGYDVLTILDYKNLIGPKIFDSEEIYEQLENDINNLLPDNYDMRVSVEYNCICNENIDPSTCLQIQVNEVCTGNYVVGDDLPDNKDIASGERIFSNIVSIEFEDQEYNNIFIYGKTKFWIWLK